MKSIHEIKLILPDEMMMSDFADFLTENVVNKKYSFDTSIGTPIEMRHGTYSIELVDDVSGGAALELKEEFHNDRLPQHLMK